MKAASFEYIEVFYNRRRQHSSLGYRSPTQYLGDWVIGNQQLNAA
jgi:transposase InsO family protein